MDKLRDFIQGDASIFILRGYAGTGKTTMVKQMADYLSEWGHVVLMAPTGRAARVLHRKTGYPASTIHKAIYGQADIRTTRNQDLAETEIKLHFPVHHPEGKVIAVVDEASMLCSKKMEHEIFQFGSDNLMDDLLDHVRPASGGKLIFVGDPAQLPPVGENSSQAFNISFFEAKGLKVVKAELTEVLRQTGDSVILKNAMQIRDLLNKEKRNQLIFEEKEGDVVSLKPGMLLEAYFQARMESGKNDCVVICYSNSTAAGYNHDIRARLYGEDNPPLQAGDILLVVQNNYQLDRMNGEFVPVLSVGATIQQSAPVYVQEGGASVRKNICMNFVHVQVTNSQGEPEDCMLLLDLLNSGAAGISIDQQRALFINFCMRNPNMRQGTEEFSKTLMHDPYYNCLRAKFGYAVTGHKCQGGEWGKVFVDFAGRTGLSDDSLRWAYTAVTRASQMLCFANLPHITPFSRFRIDPIQKCSQMNEECRVIGTVQPSPFHSLDAPNYLHAKYMCVQNQMQRSPYRVESIESKPYLEIYRIATPDGVERYDLHYKKGGIFSKAKPLAPSTHTVFITMMLDNERSMPIVFDYKPSNDLNARLFNTIRSACDSLSVMMTNVVEHPEDYSICYYFRTSYTHSYIKVYIDQNGFVTYAKPMSMDGAVDSELANLIEYIQNQFE